MVQEYATLLMSELAAIYTGRLQLIQNQALSVLLQFLEHPDPDIIRNALEALYRILEEPLNAEMLRGEEVLKPIIKLIDSDYPTVQVIALSILQKVSQLPAGTDVLEKMGLIDNLGEVGCPQTIYLSSGQLNVPFLYAENTKARVRGSSPGWNKDTD